MSRVFTKLKRVLGGQKQAIKAEHLNDIIRAVEELQNALAPSSKKNKRTATNAPPFWTSISRVPDSDPAEYQVTVETGYLTYQNAGAEESTLGPVGYIVPKIATVSIEDPAVEPITLPDPVSFVYLRVKTDADGVPKFDGSSVTVEAFDAAQESIHHVRPYPGGTPVEGDYFFLLLETESNGATPAAPVSKRRITGNRHMPNQLIEIENVGGEIELYKSYVEGASDKHQLRTIEQLTGTGKPIIKPEDPTGDTIKFRGIKEKASSPQIKVNAAAGDDEIEVRGNSFNQNFSGPVKNLNVIDGLVAGYDEITGGGNLNLTVNELTWLNDGGVMTYVSFYSGTVHYWRDGIYVGTTAPGGSPSGLIEQTVTRMIESS
jgi:hypothetical protein